MPFNICQIFPLKYAFIPQKRKPLFHKNMQNIPYNIEYSFARLHNSQRYRGLNIDVLHLIGFIPN